jgi:hypothetical protein
MVITGFDEMFYGQHSETTTTSVEAELPAFIPNTAPSATAAVAFSSPTDCQYEISSSHNVSPNSGKQ